MSDGHTSTTVKMTVTALLRCGRSSNRTHRWNRAGQGTFMLHQFLKGEPMRSVLLWLIGIPLPIIIILWLVTGHA
jgi:hypothetical protein